MPGGDQEQIQNIPQQPLATHPNQPQWLPNNGGQLPPNNVANQPLNPSPMTSEASLYIGNLIYYNRFKSLSDTKRCMLRVSLVFQTVVPLIDLNNAT